MIATYPMTMTNTNYARRARCEDNATRITINHAYTWTPDGRSIVRLVDDVLIDPRDWARGAR